MTGPTHALTSARLHQIVELRRLAAGMKGPAAVRLWRIARELRLELGEAIPKLQAARALGISVKALDKWVAKGDIPALRPPGAGRSRVETDPILDLLEEVTILREEGAASGVIAAALRRLRERGELRPKLKPNRTPAELRRAYLETTPVQRLRASAELSSVQSRLSAAPGER